MDLGINSRKAHVCALLCGPQAASAAVDSRMAASSPTSPRSFHVTCGICRAVPQLDGCCAGGLVCLP